MHAGAYSVLKDYSILTSERAREVNKKINRTDGYSSSFKGEKEKKSS